MTFDGYWEMHEEEAVKIASKLERKFWVIRDNNDNDVCRPKTYLKEEDAWKSVVKPPFNVNDYKQKGYYAVKIDVDVFKKDFIRSRYYL